MWICGVPCEPSNDVNLLCQEPLRPTKTKQKQNPSSYQVHSCHVSNSAIVPAVGCRKTMCGRRLEIAKMGSNIHSNRNFQRFSTTSKSNSCIGTLTSAETAVIDIFSKATPSVTYIDTFTRLYDVINLNTFEIPAGTGSGFVWDNEGHIVTNAHVVQKASEARVTIASSDGTSTTVKAKVSYVSN